MACEGCKSVVHGAIGLAKVAAQAVGIPVDKVCPQIIQARRDACRQCEHATKSKDPRFAATNGLSSLSKCRQCGCNIAAKTKLASEKCPLDKWGPVKRITE